MMKKTNKYIRCEWAGSDQDYCTYHDQEWGVPVHDDHTLFEFLILEGMQAGLSWLTVLRKRDHFRQAFHQFDARKIARYSTKDIERLMNNAGIIRNRLKIESTIVNARAWLSVQQEFGSGDAFLWQFVDGTPVQNAWPNIHAVPAQTAQSDAMSRALKKRGFKFVGSTICYAFMQAVGMVNDHTTDCFRHRVLGGALGRTLGGKSA